MFDLEKSIRRWRETMRAAGLKTPARLDELEVHLREEIEQLTQSGATPERAFEKAGRRLGSPQMLQAEFNKCRLLSSLPVRIVSLLWLGMILAMVATLSVWRLDRNVDLSLMAHIFTLTAGYVSALLAGVLGICGVCSRWRDGPLAENDDGLRRGIHLFTQVAFVLSLAGLVTGMIWNTHHRGYLWSLHPREVGPLVAVIWLGAELWWQRSNGQSAWRTIESSLVGNMMIGLAWFGAGAMAQNYAGGYWPLTVLLGIHLFFLGMSLTIERKPQEA